MDAAPALETNSPSMSGPLASLQSKAVVGMVLDQAFPPDARVEREALALFSAGYTVHLLCEETPANKTLSTYKGIHIHPVNPKAVRFNLPLLGETRLPYKGLLKTLARNLWNIDTAWHTLIHRFIRENQIDILHIHDLRLVSTGLHLSEKYQLPLIADLHENYPALMKLFKGRHNPKRGERQYQKWQAIQKQATQAATAVLTVSTEMKEILHAQGLSTEKITVLPNTVDIQKFLETTVDQNIINTLNPNRDRFILTYIGHINDTHRGIHTVLEALPELRKQIPNLLFVAAGGLRPTYYEQLQHLIQTHHLEECVHFTDWIDESAFRTYIEASTVCICPHIANDQTNTGIPNKVYLYHLFNRAIVASDFIPMKHYLDETHGGLYFPSGDAKGFTKAILQLYQDSAYREELATNGNRAVLNQYNWEHTQKNLLACYDAIYFKLLNNKGLRT